MTYVAAFIPVATALAIGLLYAIGSLYEAAEIRAAGLNARDVLPLIPLQQLLGRGMAVVFDNLPAILLWVATMGAGTALIYRQLGGLYRPGGLYGPGGLIEELDAMAAKFRARREAFETKTDGLAQDEPLPDELEPEAQALAAEAQELIERVDEIPRAPLTGRLPIWALVAITIALFGAVAFFSTPILAAALLTVFLLPIDRLSRGRRVSLYPALAVAILAVGAIAEGVATPESLRG